MFLPIHAGVSFPKVVGSQCTHETEFTCQNSCGNNARQLPAVRAWLAGSSLNSQHRETRVLSWEYGSSSDGSDLDRWHRD